MNIFAVVKKCINSNLDKPLNITLDEIKNSLSGGSNSSLVYKTITKVGIPYNAISSSKVLTEDDTPIVSVSGRGRIIQIIPMSDKGNTDVRGTTLFTVDGKILLNNNVQFASTGVAGRYLVDYADHHESDTVYSDIFGKAETYKTAGTGARVGDVISFGSSPRAVIVPNGIAFKNGFELRLTQSYQANSTALFGVIVIYELYE